uniref:Uncharacterized protein n=1 Tax=Picea glauca TaxID=3330 RepID=A0A101M426_PICGL|nr:hypothetical protein ABT39_MTgene288 [Picea glauca]QHR90715.1 hypothetical protein Q903MT_gene4741 [Picea sitchensis]
MFLPADGGLDSHKRLETNPTSGHSQLVFILWLLLAFKGVDSNALYFINKIFY